MEETKELHCSECGAKIEDNYYKLDLCQVFRHEFL